MSHSAEMVKVQFEYRKPASIYLGAQGTFTGHGASLRSSPVRLRDSTSNFLESKRRNSQSKLAQVREQSEFTHSG